MISLANEPNYLCAQDVKQALQKNPSFKWGNGIHTVCIGGICGLSGAAAALYQMTPEQEEPLEIGQIAKTVCATIAAFVVSGTFGFIGCFEKDAQNAEKLKEAKEILAKYNDNELLKEADVIRLKKITNAAVWNSLKNYKVYQDKCNKTE